MAKDGHFFGQKYEQNSSFCDWWQFGDGWGSVVVQNLPSERKLPMGKVQKKVNKTNNSAFSATHTYIKLTLVSFFLLFFAPCPYCNKNWTHLVWKSMLVFFPILFIGTKSDDCLPSCILHLRQHWPGSCVRGVEK